MLQRLKTLGRQTAVYGIAGVSIQVVGLVTLPVFARTFTPAEYGTLELLTVIIAALMVIADLGLSSAMQRHYYDHPDDDHEGRLTVTSTAIGSASLLVVVVCSVIVLLRDPISEYLFETDSHGDLVALAALAVPLGLLANLFREVMRLRFQAGHFVVSSVIAAAVTGFGGVLAVTTFDSGIGGVLVASVAGLGTAALYGLFVARDAIGLRFSWSELRGLMAFGAPLVPAAAALWALSFLDRLMISKLGGLAETGQFAVATRFSSVLMFLVVAFGTAYSPFLLALWAEDPEEEKEVRAKVLTYVSVTLSGCALAVGLFAEELAQIITPGFDEAYKAVGILSLGVAAYGVSSVTLSGLSIARRTKWIAIYAVIGLAVNLALNLVLIPPLGVAGAALATMAGYMVLAAGYYIRSQQVYWTPYEPGKTLLAFAGAGAILPLAFVHAGSELADLALRAGGLLVFVVAMFALRVIGPDEQAVLRQMLRRGVPAS